MSDKIITYYVSPYHSIQGTQAQVDAVIDSLPKRQEQLRDAFIRNQDKKIASENFMSESVRHEFEQLRSDNARMMQALTRIRDGYGPQHPSKWARSIAARCLIDIGKQSEQ